MKNTINEILNFDEKLYNFLVKNLDFELSKIYLKQNFSLIGALSFKKTNDNIEYDLLDDLFVITYLYEL
jgi:hypothetical protein